jgi:hypothetical protein
MGEGNVGAFLSRLGPVEADFGRSPITYIDEASRKANLPRRLAFMTAVTIFEPLPYNVEVYGRPGVRKLREPELNEFGIGGEIYDSECLLAVQLSRAQLPLHG